MDTTNVQAMIALCVAAAAVVGGAMLCGLPSGCNPDVGVSSSSPA
jgi:hypothetical protein